MKTIVILSLLLSTLCSSHQLQAQRLSDSLSLLYFIEIQDENIQVGTMKLVQKGKKQHVEQEYWTHADSLYKIMFQQLHKLGPQKPAILLSIHSMWGDKEKYLPNNLQEFSANLLENKDSQVGLIFSIIWHGGSRYSKNLENADDLGQAVAPSIKQFLHTFQQYKNQNVIDSMSLHVLCHSMGHRVLEGMLSAWSVDDFEQPVFDEMVFAAPDLDVDIFAPNRSFEQIDTWVERLHIYHHSKDRFLGLSKMVIHKKRLGKHDFKAYNNKKIVRIDVSQVPSKTLVGKWSNHLYLARSPKVQQDMVQILNGIPNSDILGRVFVETGRYVLK